MTPCDVEARCWRDGLRWQVVLQVTYYANEGRSAGMGPFFVLGHTWSEKVAQVRVREENGRLAAAEDRVRNWARGDGGA